MFDLRVDYTLNYIGYEHKDKINKLIVKLLIALNYLSFRNVRSTTYINNTMYNGHTYYIFYELLYVEIGE